MTLAEAEQIAALINERNQLARAYTSKPILNCAAFYEYEIVDGKVASCVQRKELQWYQWEILHLSSAKEYEGSQTTLTAALCELHDWCRSDGAHVFA